MTAIRGFHSMRDHLKGAGKFAGDAFNVGHAWIIDIPVVLLQNSQSCYIPIRTL